jgi:hypothetical protein
LTKIKKIIAQLLIFKKQIVYYIGRDVNIQSAIKRRRNTMAMKKRAVKKTHKRKTHKRKTAKKRRTAKKRA